MAGTVASSQRSAASSAKGAHAAGTASASGATTAASHAATHAAAATNAAANASASANVAAVTTWAADVPTGAVAEPPAAALASPDGDYIATLKKRMQAGLRADARWIVLADASDTIAQTIALQAAQAAPKTAASRLPQHLFLCRHQRDVHALLAHAVRTLSGLAQAREADMTSSRAADAQDARPKQDAGPRLLRVGIIGSSMVLRGALTYYVDYQAEHFSLPPLIFAFVPSAEGQPLVASLKQADGRYARLFGDSEWNAMVRGREGGLKAERRPAGLTLAFSIFMLFPLPLLPPPPSPTLSQLLPSCLLARPQTPPPASSIVSTPCAIAWSSTWTSLAAASSAFPLATSLSPGRKRPRPSSPRRSCCPLSTRYRWPQRT